MKNKLYKKYFENNETFPISYIHKIIINDNEEKVKLYTADFFFGIKIYDFHNGKKLCAYGVIDIYFLKNLKIKIVRFI